MPAAAAIALVRANARFWPAVLPVVREELRRWDLRARAIPDPALRAVALRKLDGERFNAEVAATFATLAPERRRRDVVTAIVALQVMYDYLDGVTEQPVADPLASGRQLYRAFGNAFARVPEPVDHYLHHPHGSDGGYLAALQRACRRALWSLPAAAVAAPVAAAVAARCGEAQTRTHAVPRLGAGQLCAWALMQPETGELRWWEVASGAVAWVLAAHALIAAAADPATTAEQARAIASAHLATCALTTQLDSLVDADEDAAGGGHAYLAYYRDDAEAAERLRLLARRAAGAAQELPHGPHHLMTVAGAVAFYLSAPAARSPRARRVTGPLTAELGPLLRPALTIFRSWRRAKRIAALRRLRPPRIGSAGARSAGSHGCLECVETGSMGAMPIASDSTASSSSGSTAVVSSTAAARGHRTLGRQLERDRLEQRAERVRRVIVALRERAAAREGHGGAPRPLTAAIEDFGRELADLERRLRHVSAR